MHGNRDGGLRSDGELVQAAHDTFDFQFPQDRPGLLLPAVQTGERAVEPDHRTWVDRLNIEVDVSVADKDDDGLPDTIIWCIDGDGEGGREITVEFDFTDRSWSIETDGVFDLL